MPLLLLFLLFFSSLHATSLDEDLQNHIKWHAEGQNNVGKIVIDDKSNGISQATWVYVKNALDYYKQHKPAFIILELNTPGGEVYSAQKISDALKDMDIQMGVPIVAYINNWAISAGAMLAYSSRFIAIAKDASMGAAEPVIQGTGDTELKTASEKVNSAFRTDFANRAGFFDRNPLLAEAMVDKDIILVLRDGKILKLDQENQIRTAEPNPDRVISAKGKLLTLDAKELMEFNVANILLEPVRLESISEKEQASGHYPASKEALFQYPFFKNIPNAAMDVYKMDWKTQFFVLLANPIVASALMLAMMLGFYIEFNTPGFGLPGTVALTALFLIILSSFSLEIADKLELIFIITGLLILAAEVFLLPTFGLLGFIGVILFLIGFFGLLLPGIGSIEYEFDTQTFNAAGEAFIDRLGYVLGTLFIGMGMILLLARYIAPSFHYLKRLVLTGHEQEGYTAGLDEGAFPTIGKEGLAVSFLRPSGKVTVDGVLFDAMSRGRYIEKGAKVKVVGHEASTLIVEQL